MILHVSSHRRSPKTLKTQNASNIRNQSRYTQSRRLRRVFLIKNIGSIFLFVTLIKRQTRVYENAIGIWLKYTLVRVEPQIGQTMFLICVPSVPRRAELGRESGESRKWHLRTALKLFGNIISITSSRPSRLNVNVARSYFRLGRRLLTTAMCVMVYTCAINYARSSHTNNSKPVNGANSSRSPGYFARNSTAVHRK